MKRRVLLALGAGAVIAPRWLLAQSARMPRIGYLLLTPITEPPSRERQAFLDGLREFGHVPGKTVEIVYRSAEGELEFIDAVSQELLAQKPDLVLVCADVPTALRVEVIETHDLPPGWRATPAPEALARLGTSRVAAKRSPVLSVPSVVLPVEKNYLLDPAHPSFSRIAIARPEALTLDPRLWKGRTR